MVLGFGHPEQHPEEPRGRAGAVRTGRGGVGNMVRSPSRGRAAGPDPEEVAAYHLTADNPPATVSSGRGGVGNVRSPSRDPLDRARIATQEHHDQELQEQYLRQEASVPHYSPAGRGGRGNIHREGSLERPVRGPSQERERGRKEGPVGSLLRTFSRSRSRELSASRHADSTESPPCPYAATQPPGSGFSELGTARAPPKGPLADVEEGLEVTDSMDHLPQL